MKRLAIFDPELLNKFLQNTPEIVEHLPYASGSATMAACISATILAAFECSIENFEYMIVEDDALFIGKFKHTKPTKSDILNAMEMSDIINDTVERLWGDTDEI